MARIRVLDRERHMQEHAEEIDNWGKAEELERLLRETPDLEFDMEKDETTKAQYVQHCNSDLAQILAQAERDNPRK